MATEPGAFHGMQIAEEFVRAWADVGRNPTSIDIHDQALAIVEELSREDLLECYLGLASIAVMALAGTGDFDGSLRWLMLAGDVNDGMVPKVRG